MEGTDRSTVYVLVTVFSCFMFSIVSASWFEISQTIRSLASFVILLYIVVMIFGICATILAYKCSVCRNSIYINGDSTNNSAGVRNLENSESVTSSRQKGKYVHIVGMLLFVFPVVFGDILMVVNAIQCIPPFAAYCNVSESVFFAILKGVRVFYVGSQMLYILWCGKQLKNNANYELDSRVHVVNIAINISLLIQNIMYENKVVFYIENSHSGAVCDMKSGNKTFIWSTEMRSCYNNTSEVGQILQKTENIFLPIVTEFLFLACAILYEQWNKIEQINSSAPDSEDDSMIETEADESMHDSESSESEILSQPNGRRPIIKNVNEIISSSSPCSSSLPIAMRQPFEEDNSLEDSKEDILISQSVTDNAQSENENRSSLHLKHFLIFLLPISSMCFGLSAYNNSLTMNLLFYISFGCNLLVGIVFCSQIISYLQQKRLLRITELDMGSCILILCTSGVFLYNNFDTLPGLLALTAPKLRQTLIDRMCNSSGTVSFYTTKFDLFAIINFTLCLVENTLTALMAFIFVFLRNDLKNQVVALKEWNQTKPKFYLLIVGHIGLWIFKSVLFATYTKTKPVQMAFYDNETWSRMVHLVNPLAVYYHFNVVLCMIEYVLSI